jgi:hypothetical protein
MQRSGRDWESVTASPGLSFSVDVRAEAAAALAALGCMIDESSKRWVRLGLATEHPGPCPGCRTLLSRGRHTEAQMTQHRSTDPKSDDLPSTVRWLLSELERATSAEPASPKNERERYIYIQVALSKFVRKVGGTLEQSRHICELAQHLADLDLGIVSPVLEPARFGKGKTGDSSLVWGARGSVAMGLEALIRLGKSREDAAKSALRDLPGISRLMTAKSKNSVAAMLSWHDEFLRWQAGKGRIKNRYLADTFDIGAEGLELAGSPVLLGCFAQFQFARASRI